MKTNITVHTIVKNEEKWVWYALMSVKDYVDKILVYDTDSTDRTVEIIKSIKDKKIDFEKKGEVDADQLVKLRQEQIEKTTTEWFLIVDGDEIWPKKTIEEFKKLIQKNNENLWGVVIRAWNFVGDVYHYHPESDYYHWPFAPKSYKGWANLRGIKKNIPGLHIKGSYPLEAYCDSTGKPIQNYGEKRLGFLTNRYLHTSYLIRSSSREVDKTTLNRTFKNKMEIGKRFPKRFEYPEVFYKKAPEIVSSPWKRRSTFVLLVSMILTPIKYLKRSITRSF